MHYTDKTWKIIYNFSSFVCADDMFVLSTSNQRVSVQLLGKDKIHDKLSRLEELTSVSLSYMGISSPGIASHINNTVPSKLDSRTLPFLC